MTNQPNNVIPFPFGQFSLLNGCSDGWFICYSDSSGPVEAIGPFRDIAAARNWAIQNGGSEGVLIDWTTFPPPSDSEGGGHDR